MRLEEIRDKFNLTNKPEDEIEDLLEEEFESLLENRSESEVLDEIKTLDYEDFREFAIDVFSHYTN